MSINKYAFGILLFILPFYGKPEEPVYDQSIQSITVLKTDTTTTGQKIAELFSNPSEITGLRVTIPPGKETGWHKHTVPGFAYVLKGDLTVETENGKKFEFIAGQSFAEVVNTNHNGKNNGKVTVELIAFFVGQKGQGITIKSKLDEKK
jgi:quercetin dioxygenase-like cupin family protein